EKGAELDGAYTRILDKALQELLDRLEQGDPFVVGGEVKRKPVSARDLALVAAITYDKRRLSRDAQLAATAHAAPNNDELWERLGNWSRAHPIERKIPREHGGPDFE